MPPAPGRPTTLPTPGCRSTAEQDHELPEFDLLSPLTIHRVTLRNRIGMSPMCQYVARDGFADHWHLVHLGSRATSGVALVIVEATAVTPDGRITPGDTGIWDDRHVEPFARIVRFAHSQGAAAGIQLAHAGREASCDVSWRCGQPLPPDQGGWPVIAPSPIPFRESAHVPKAIDQAGIKSVIEAFARAADRAVRAGFDLVELHFAHGYLMHSFLSPLSNHRTDEYGGSLDGRMRLPLTGGPPRPPDPARRHAPLRPHLRHRLGRRRPGHRAIDRSRPCPQDRRG